MGGFLVRATGGHAVRPPKVCPAATQDIPSTNDWLTTAAKACWSHPADSNGGERLDC
jgi:hypothetical protein